MFTTPKSTTPTTATSDPLIAWQRLRSGNERLFQPVQGYRGNPIDDRPVAAVFRCADTGLASEMVFGQSYGSLIDVSNWGHVVDNGALASLEYAVDVLAVPLIVVLGHHNCPAMRMAMQKVTCGRMTDCLPSATLESISTPRFIGPGCSTMASGLASASFSAVRP